MSEPLHIATATSMPGRSKSSGGALDFEGNEPAELSGTGGATSLEQPGLASATAPSRCFGGSHHIGSAYENRAL